MDADKKKRGRPKGSKTLPKLSAQQKIAIEAYAAVGFKDQAGALAKAGYSPRTNAGMFFARPHVAREVERFRQKVVRKLGIDTPQLIEELKFPAFLDLSNIWALSDDGQPYPDWSRLTPDQLRCVKSIKSETYVEGRGKDAPRVKRITVEFHDKLKSVEMLGRHTGMFEADNSQKAPQLSVSDLIIQHRAEARIDYDNLPVCETVEQALRLPIGAHFKTPDGKIKVRPE